MSLLIVGHSEGQPQLWNHVPLPCSLEAACIPAADDARCPDRMHQLRFMCAKPLYHAHDDLILRVLTLCGQLQFGYAVMRMLRGLSLAWQDN
jgi:hypothetical protein